VPSLLETTLTWSSSLTNASVRPPAWDEETIRNDIPARYLSANEWGGNAIYGADEEKRCEESVSLALRSIAHAPSVLFRVLTRRGRVLVGTLASESCSPSRGPRSTSSPTARSSSRSQQQRSRGLPLHLLWVLFPPLLHLLPLLQAPLPLSSSQACPLLSRRSPPISSTTSPRIDSTRFLSLRPPP
jgi:hypothetical protein